MGEASRRRAALEPRIDAVWEHGTILDQPPDPTPWRYVPRGHSVGGGWDVFDKKEGRFVFSDELVDIPVETLAQELIREQVN